MLGKHHLRGVCESKAPCAPSAVLAAPGSVSPTLGESALGPDAAPERKQGLSEGAAAGSPRCPGWHGVGVGGMGRARVSYPPNPP